MAPGGQHLPGGVDAVSALPDNRPPDLRLAALALATWLSAFAALHTRAVVALAMAATAAAAAAVLWRWVGRGGAVGAGIRPAGPARHTGGGYPIWAGIAVAVLLGVVCGGAATAARLVARDAAAVTQPARDHATVTVALTVRNDPVKLGRDAGRPPSWMVPAWLDRIRVEDADPAEGAPTRVRVRVLVFAADPRWQPLLPGQRLVATGRLGPARGGDLTAAVLSATGPPQPVGDPPWVQRAAGTLRAGLRAACAPLPIEPGGLLPGLVVGDISQLDPGLSDDFLATGMTHMVAVSGSNCAIVVGFVFLIARAARAPPWLTATISGLALVGFVILVRADPAVVRAGAMAAIALVALAAGRLRAAVPALGATITCLVVVDPQLAGDAAFTLSVLATGGLLLLAPRWRDALRRWGVPPGLAEALAVPAAAQVAVAPVVAAMSGTVSLVAVAANLLATPAVAPATILGVLAAVLSPVSMPAAELLAWLASWPAWWLVLVSRYAAQVPAAVVPWPDGWRGGLLLAGLTVAVLVGARHRVVRRLVAVAAVAVIAGALPVKLVASGWPPAAPVVVTCAVGQGDMVVLPLGHGEAIVVDAGPEPAAADRCLRDLGVRSVPLLVVSHYHVDHVGGLEAVLRGREVAAVLTPARPEPDFGHDLVAGAAAQAAVPVQVARAGASYTVGEVSLTVLGPAYELTGTRSDPNNNSVVLLADVGGVTVLLAGDAEVELQRALREDRGAAGLRADVLKVPHHGSAFQDQGFLDAVAPAVAMVPVGEDNDYGHPDPGVVGRLERAGARVLRTDTDGDVAVVRLDSGALAVVTRPLPVGAD